MDFKKQLALVAADTVLKSSEFKQLVSYAGEVVTDTFRNAWKWLCSKFRSPSEPVFFMEGVPNVKDELSYRQHVSRNTGRKYTVKHRLRHDDQYITGISCVPLREGLPGAETEVVSGGLNYREVELCLSPVADADWGCDIKIIGTPHKKPKGN